VKRLLVPLVALVVVAAGCDALGDDVAATVAGRDITIGQVTDLMPIAAKLPSAPSATARGGDVIDGELARFALSLEIQGQVFSYELHRRKGTVTQADRSSIEQELTSNLPGLSAKGKQALVDLFAPVAALRRVLGADSSQADVDAAAAKIVAGLSQQERQQVCIVGIVGPQSGRAQAQAAVDAGAAITDAAAFEAAGFQAVTTGDPLCLTLTSVAPELAQALQSTPTGSERTVDFTSSQGPATLFFRVTGQQQLTAQDPEVQQQAQQQVASQADPTAVITSSKAKVDVDPRFGRGYDPSKGIIAPLTPSGDTEAPQPASLQP
jgi:hypothetical protein